VIRNVFLFIGADPATRTTGTQRPPLPLESNVPGVFAAGDARSGSVKRVGGAIGEGAAAQLHG
jgi:thioredoxin reductase (NADPH)